jgi:putative Mg2+ transporter-C (MgtC) family protein
MNWLDFTVRIAVAVLLGALIGLERQWRQRLAGLRTNALVSAGSGAFVALSALLPHVDDSSRIAAQVVSGIGFLGAGVILREGLNVRGLNTAATLWCSAAVGTLSGSGFLIPAAITTFVVIASNVLLRPLGLVINQRPNEATEAATSYRIQTTCRETDEHHIRTLLLHSIGAQELTLRGIRSQDINGSGKVHVGAELIAQGRCDKLMEQLINRLSLEPGLSAVSWENIDDDALIAE